MTFSATWCVRTFAVTYNGWEGIWWIKVVALIHFFGFSILSSHFLFLRCGPCKASKPKLKELADKSPLPIGYVHEEDIEDFLEIFVEIKAFPTYILFKDGEEKARLEGVDFAALEKMIAEHSSS